MVETCAGNNGNMHVFVLSCIHESTVFMYLISPVSVVPSFTPPPPLHYNGKKHN